MRLFKLLLVVSLFSFNLFADEHPLSNITGTNISLKMYDHAIAGSIKGFVVFGYKKNDEYASRLMMRKDGQIIEAQFAPTEKGFGGTISHSVGEDTFKTTLKLMGIIPDQQAILMDINGAAVQVDITADDFVENHFVNPTFTAMINGEKVSFTLENSNACYGFATQLVFLIFGAYVH